MAAAYERRFGAAGTVIHPTRGSAPAAASVAPRVRQASPPLTFAYGGSINSRRQFDQILSFSGVAAAAGHRTVVYTPQYDSLRHHGAAPAFDLRPAVAPADLVRALRDEADCLFLPQPFDDADRAMSSTSFPSKWVEYSSVGLPLIVWAPSWATSAQFALDHKGCAEVITTPDTTELAHAIARLAGSSAYRAELADRALTLGRHAFAPETAWNTFWTALQS